MQLLKTTLTILLVAFIADICYAFTKMPAKESTSESCPAENTIVQIHATYTAPGAGLGKFKVSLERLKHLSRCSINQTTLNILLRQGNCFTVVTA